MRRGHHQTSINYNQTHHHVKMMSIISLIFLLVHTILSPISQYVDAQGNGLGISLSTSSVNETEELVATLIDKDEESNGPLSFTVPDGLTISGILVGQENIESISNSKQTLQFNWTENSNKVVQVQLQAQKAGDYTATFSSSDATVSASVTVVAQLTDEVESNQTETETIATEEESSDDDEADTSISQDKEESETVATEEKEDAAETPSFYDARRPNYDDSIFDHIDIETVGSFKYKVDGVEKTVSINLDSLSDLGTLTIYEGTSADISNGTAKEITVEPKKQASTTPGYKYEWRYSGNFDKDKTYTVVYDFTVDVDGETHYFHFEQEYTFDGNTNICPGFGSTKGIDIAINASDLENIVTKGSLTLSKEAVDTAGNALNGSFTFVITSEANKYSKTIQATTTNGSFSTTINGLKAGEYIITEQDPSGAISEYKLNAVTVNVGGTDSDATETNGNYSINATIEQGEGQTVAFKNVYKQDNPSIKVEKSIIKKEAVDGEYVFAPGETVEYEIKVTNDGNVDLTNVTLSDELLRDRKLSNKQLTINGYDGAFSLAAGQEKTFTATFVVPEKEVGGTVYKNTATAKAGDLEKSDDAEFTVESQPGLEVTKTVDQNKVKPGDKVTYTITVTNTGNTVLEKVTLADLMKRDNVVMDKQLVLMDGENKYDRDSFTLGIGDSKTFTADYKVPAKTKVGTVFYNVATATSGNLVDSDDATVTVDNDPNLAVEKSVNKNEAKPGETVTYTYTVTNTGNSDLQVTLSDVFSKDGVKLDEQLVLKDAEGKIYKGEAFTLAYEGVATFTAEFTIPENTKVDTKFHNVVTATSDDLEVTDDATVTVAKDPGLAVDKSVDKKVAKPGETVIYTYTVTNTGNSDLKVTLADVFSKNDEEMDKQLVIYDQKGNVYDGEVFDLDYKGVVTFIAEYTIPANTKEGTTFNNVVTVKSDELTATDNETVTVDKDPALSVDKSVDKNVAKPGETVKYTYIVTNLGNSDLEVTLADVFSKNGKEMDDQLVLKDQAGNVYNGKAFTLAYEGTVTFTAEYTIPANTKVDTEFYNVVTATSGDLVATDNETVTVDNDPGLSVDKAVDKNEALPGETVKYTYTVTNTGNSDLEVTLTDVFSKNGKEMDKQLVLKDAEGNIYEGEAFKLAYKGTATFTAEYKIPENTKVDTVFHNIVTATSGNLTDTDEENVTVLNNPGLEVDKSVDKNEAKPGETVKYTYTVTNTGNSDLEVTLADAFSKGGIAVPATIEQLVLKDAAGNVYNGEVFKLAYKGEVKFTAEYTIPENTKVDTQFHNVVTVISGDLEASDEETVTVSEDPGMTVDKSVDKNVAKPGEKVTYTYTVTNTGNSDLEVTLTDVFSKNGKEMDDQLVLKDQAGNVYNGEAFTLAYEGTATFTAEYTIPANTKVDTEFYNVVTATSGDLVATDNETVTVDNDPGLSVDKAVDKNEALPGETVKYTYTVTNTGNSDLEVTLKDVFSKVGDEASATLEQLVIKDAKGNVYNGEVFTLAYKGEVKFTAEYTIPDNTKVDTVFHNVVTVTSGNLTDTDEENVKVLNKPGLAVDKSVDKTEALPGETVKYTYTVTNTGNSNLEVTLKDVFSKVGDEASAALEQLVIKDAEGNVYNGEVFDLAYKGTATFTAEYTIPENTKVDTQFHNVVTVISGDLEASDEETVTVSEDPGMTVNKSVDKNVAKPGEKVIYTYTVTNTGNSDLKVTLKDVFSKNDKEMDKQLVLKDARGNVYNGEVFDLAYKGVVTFTAEYTIPANTKEGTTFNNVVTVKSGELTATDNETVTVDKNPSLSVDKSVDKNVAKPGETVTYTYTVTNLGNTDLEVTLADVFSENGTPLDEQLVLKNQAGNVYNGEAFTLAYEGVATFTAEYTIPENTKVDTKFHNVVTATSGDIVKTDEETVTVANNPGLAVDKSVDKNVAKPGEKVTYTYTVTNTGNSDLKVTLTDVFSKNGKEMDKQLVLKDAEGNVYNGEAFTLAYEGVATFTAEYTIPANTKEDTKFYNVVKATSGNLVATDNETVTVDNNPGLMVDKAVNKNVAKPGETVTYTYTVTNTGNSDLEVTLKDVFSKNGKEMDKQLVLKDQAGNVYNGEAFTLAYEGKVTFTAKYKIPANAKAGTQFHNVVTVTSGDLVATDDETVTVDRDLGMTVVKTADQNSAKPGETVTYKIVVSNTGNTDLNVTLSDVFSENGKVMEEQLVLKDAQGNVYKGEAFTLAYGQTATFTAEYTIPEDAKAGTVYHNVATVADGNLVVTDDEDVTVDQVPSLKVEKTADKTQYLPGETVTYTINVTNDGNVDLKGITLDDVFSKNDVVADQQLTVEGYEGAFDLAIGETMSFTSKFVIPENDLADTTYKNVVTATTGDTTGEDEETIVVDPKYAFTIEKTADKTEAAVGETVTYSIVVTNTGNKALTNVHVKDDMIGLDTVIDQLAVNESKTLTGEYVVTADDIGDLENIATATVEVDDETITHDASVIVKVSAKVESAVDETPTIDDETPTTTDKVVNGIQNPQTGDTTINTLLILVVFVLAGSGLYAYRRKLRG